MTDINWKATQQLVDDLVASGEKVSYKKLEKLLGIPHSTLHNHITIGKRMSTHYNKDGDVEVSAETDFPKTPEQMAQLAGIDLKDYNIKSFDCFAREVYVKDIKKNLTFDEGKITGEIHDKGKMKVKTIWSSRLVVQPLVVKPRSLALAQVNVVVEPREFEKPSVDRNREELTLIIPDIHFGYGKNGAFQDVDALDAVLGFIQRSVFNRVVLLGDVLDLAEFTDKYLQEPEVIRSTQVSLEDAANFLGYIRQLVGNEIPVYWIEGNHELRLQNMIRRHLSALAGLRVAESGEQAISIPKMLNLDKLNVEYVSGYPDNFIRVGDVDIIHGQFIGSKPGQTALKNIEKLNRSVIYGHIHRREYVETKVWDGNGYKTIFAYTPGCLCRTDGSVPGSSPLQGWGQGIGILVTRKSGESYVLDYRYDPRIGKFLL